MYLLFIILLALIIVSLPAFWGSIDMLFKAFKLLVIVIIGAACMAAVWAFVNHLIVLAGICCAITFFSCCILERL